ncbi:hypothetical protein BDV95DRAFT_633413 [Massariosphaeria phaeospora]|uniref:Carrier domain-containing protein n=1 Tax=Massariosphaeria phaeospora TaxID=100035 RepID=A0A7C8MGI8_9PLEO|nr:hypothetical protein BDV95DRAFT_633413 [Massariosphaeria phaeospora]
MGSLIDQIRQHSQRSPSHIAIVDGGIHITYGMLLSAVQVLSCELTSKGCGPGTKIPILATSSSETIVAFLAVVEIGACFIPIDAVQWTGSKIATILDSLSPSLAISTNPQISFTCSYEMLSLEGLWDDRFKIRGMKGFEPPRNDEHESPAYIIFTSGTTGLPKGVMVSLASVSHYVNQGNPDIPFNLGVTPGDVVLSVLSVAFDAYTVIGLSTLCNGGTLMLSSPSTFVQDSQRCTILPITPSLLRMLCPSENHDLLRTIFLGGETPDLTVVSKWSTDRRRVFNGYGATETTCTCLMAELVPGKPITLGQCISDSQVFLLDDTMQPCDEGEIVVGGKALAIGYYENMEKTEQSFVMWNDRRVYRTGDYARRTEDGLIFLGRKDSLVKNRNVRINLETEVIPALRSCLGVTSATAFISQDQLVAFVTPVGLDGSEIRRVLLATTDTFHVPDLVKPMQALPLNPNGKINTNLLRQSLESTFRSPRSDTAIQTGNLDFLRGIISNALGINKVEMDTAVSFWELGGSSLTAIRTLSLLHAQGLTVPMKSLMTLSLNALGERLQPLEHQTSPSCDKNAAQATPLQLQMARSSIHTPRSAHIFLELEFDLRKSFVTPAIFESAWRLLINRHTIFSCAMDMATGALVSTESSQMRWTTSAVDDVEFQTAIRTASEDLLAPKWHIDGQDLYYSQNAFHLVSNGGTRMTLLWLVHHSLVDGWSVGILMKELDDTLLNRPLSSTPQFDEFLACRQQHVARISNASENYWKDTITVNTSSEGGSLLRNVLATFGDSVPIEVQCTLPVTLREIEQTSGDLKVSTACIFHTAWAIVLPEHTANDSVTFGTVLSGRSIAFPGIENVVGPVINTCPVFFHVPHEGPVFPLMRRVQETLLDLHDHQWTANNFLETLVPGTPTPQFESLLAVEIDLPTESQPKTIARMPLKIVRRDFPELPLVVYIELENTELSCKFIFDERIGKVRAQNMLDHFCNVIRSFSEDSNRNIQETRRKMLGELNMDNLIQKHAVIASDLDQFEVLQTSFERSVDSWPTAVAIQQGRTAQTYTQLETKSNSIARAIRKYVDLGQVVALASDGTIEWIVAVLGIVKSGAVYAPVDMMLPDSRIENLVRRSQANLLLITNKPCDVRLSELSFPCPRLRTDHIEESAKRMLCSTTGSAAAFLVFTSGSTGPPKPVLVKHGAITSLLSMPEARLHSCPGRKIAQIYSVGFDVSILEIFGSLCHGGTLVLKDPNDPIKHLLSVNAAMATPSLLSALSPDDYPNLDTILLAGEVVTQTIVDLWLPRVRLYNAYGPCECSIFTTIGEMQKGGGVTIGKPVSNSRVYILNRRKRPLPVGAVGEICVSGINVADGYVGQTISENLKFSTDPFEPCARMYSTGDFGAWTSDGQIVFHGRKDAQVKIRGYRVELEEIESAILSLSPCTTHAGAFVEQDRLYAAVAPASIEKAILMRKLAEVLPQYAIPAHIFIMNNPILSSNGKLDRIALKQAAMETFQENLNLHHDPANTPCTRTEVIVADAWREILEIPPATAIDACGNFLQLGGNSLRQIRLLPNLSRKLSQSIPLRLIILNPTLRDLASAIDAHLLDNDSHNSIQVQTSFLEFLRTTTSRETTVITSREAEMFWLWSRSTCKPAFNIITKLKIDSKIDTERFKLSVNAVLIKHKVLRSTFRLNDNELSRKLLAEPPPLEEMNSDGLLHECLGRPIDPTYEHPIQAFLHAEKSFLSFILKLHHILGDKASIKQLLREISTVYLQMSESEQQPELPTVHYTQYASWLEVNPLSFVPADGNTLEFIIPQTSGLSANLEQCLVAVAYGVFKVTAFTDIVLGISYMDRSEPGTETMIGLFLESIPLRLTSPTALQEITSEFLRCVRENINSALLHSVPSNSIKQTMDVGSLFDIMVTLHKKEDSYAREFDSLGISVQEEKIRMPGARFPLLIEFEEMDEGIHIYIEYATSLVTNRQAEKLKTGIMDTFSLICST